MIWLTWRQFRMQLIVTLAAVSALAIYLFFIGREIQDFYDTQIVGCTGEACSNAQQLLEDTYLDKLFLIGAALLCLPAIIGIFWGAPLIARELETGTHRLVWNQSVTRTRWLAVKLGLIALFSLAVTGLFSLLLSWAAQPVDKLVGSRFAAVTFDSRDLAPLGYAVFAFALGTTMGLLIRRTLPAMAVTLAIFIAVQIVMPTVIRPHLMSPVTSAVAFTSDIMEKKQVDGVGSSGEGGGGDTAPIGIVGYTKPGAWILSSSFLPLLKADGSDLTRADMRSCMTGEEAKPGTCLASKNVHFNLTYHPAGRYWAFQWIETAIFLALALALAGLCFWRIPRIAS
jgi:ABC-type transport system involved in multi-copper enzyme maturation permease subunit